MQGSGVFRKIDPPLRAQATVLQKKGGFERETPLVFESSGIWGVCRLRGGRKRSAKVLERRPSRDQSMQQFIQARLFFKRFFY